LKKSTIFKTEKQEEENEGHMELEREQHEVNEENKFLDKINSNLENKYERLVEWFKVKNDRVLIALSGGVDSAVVALVARNAMGKNNVLAVTANYQTLSNEELYTAVKVANELDISHKIIEYNELENQNFVKNDSLRCFHCRNELADNLTKLASQEDIKLIVDGSNVDDLNDYRPGMIALHQKGIKSPLIETGFNKNDIRDLAKVNKLSIHDKPSNACLASRISKNIQITSTKLKRIENCESAIKKVFNVKQVRVRDHGDLARIEVGKEEMAKLFDTDKLNEVESPFKENGFRYVTIDIGGYKKSGGGGAEAVSDKDVDIQFIKRTGINIDNRNKQN
jgi:uncharacterized protein